jgi:hypothetical protein
LNLIKSKDGFPSLANLQLFMWSEIILFAFLSIYILRVSGGVFDPPDGILPANILKLLGISAVVPAVSVGINFYKYGAIAGNDGNKEWNSILLERGRPSLTRFQMFVWTWIGVIIYLTVFFGSLYVLTLSSSPVTFSQVVLPDVDPTLVVLMGISQGSYVAGKVTAPKIKTTDPLPKT